MGRGAVRVTGYEGMTDRQIALDKLNRAIDRSLDFGSDEDIVVLEWNEAQFILAVLEEDERMEDDGK